MTWSTLQHWTTNNRHWHWSTLHLIIYHSSDNHHPQFNNILFIIVIGDAYYSNNIFVFLDMFSIFVFYAVLLQMAWTVISYIDLKMYNKRYNNSYFTVTKINTWTVGIEKLTTFKQTSVQYTRKEKGCLLAITLLAMYPLPKVYAY